MGRMILVGTLIVGGVLAPLIWLNPWRYSREKQAILEILRRHPRVTLKKLEVISGSRLAKEVDSEERFKHGLLLTASIQGYDVAGMTAFRRALRSDPVLGRMFPTFVVPVVCTVYDPNEPPDPPVDFSVYFLPGSK